MGPGSGNPTLKPLPTTHRDLGKDTMQTFHKPSALVPQATTLATPRPSSHARTRHADVAVTRRPISAPGGSIPLARCWTFLAAWLGVASHAMGQGGDPLPVVNTGLHVINTAINVATYAQQLIDGWTQTRAQADVAIAEYWHRRVEGYWDQGKQVVSRRLTYLYQRPSMSLPPIARWIVRDAQGRVVDQGTNVLYARMALRDTSCTQAPRTGTWNTDAEGYLLMGLARVLSSSGHTLRNPEVQANRFEATVHGLRQHLNPTNGCLDEVMIDALPPKRLTLKFNEPTYFQLESTNTVEVQRAGSSNVVAVVPRLVRNRVYDLPGSLVAGWNEKLGTPSPEEAMRLLRRAESVGRAPGHLRDKAVRAVLLQVGHTYRDGLPEVQVLPPPRRGKSGFWDVHLPDASEFPAQ